jgi:hypothetical protein
MKGALIVGIDNYPNAPLKGCVNDATAISEMLHANGDGTLNFQVELRLNVATRAKLRAMIIKLFQSDLHTALFYFSGHGCINDRGGFIVTPDFNHYDEGISMDEILNIVNQSRIKDKIVIIDSCHAGALGNPVIIGSTASYLAEGVSILTAARSSEVSIERKGHGVFTSLLLSALQGGAADIAGNVTPGSVYAYIDRSLGFWDQRPQFKTNVNRFIVLRTVTPSVPLNLIMRNIVEYFKEADMLFPLNPSYEYTNEDVAVAENVAIFKSLQKMQSVGLVTPVDEEHMYWAAQRSKACRLTPLGMHYWNLARSNRI